MKTLSPLLILGILCFINTITANAQSWSLSGNAGTVQNTNFLGTTDNKKLNIRTNNVNRMTIASNGKVGIGTANPTDLLHMNGGVLRIDQPQAAQEYIVLNSQGLGNTQIHFRQNDVSQAVLHYDQSGQAFGINVSNVNTTNFAIAKATGYVGIGDNLAPQERLHVVGKVRIDESGASFLQLNSTGLGNVTMQFTQQGAQRTSLGFDNSTNDFVIATDDLGLRPDFIINRTNGFVGLGTKTPGSKLHIQDGDLEITNGGENFFLKVNSSGQLDFVPNSSATAASVTIDDGNGNVGIGTSSPANKLDVQGGANFFGNIGVQTAANTHTIQCGATQGSLLGIGTAEYIQDAGTSSLSTNNDWLPTSDNIWSLGSSSNRWQDVWAVDGSINTSDQRDKTNIRDMNYGLKEIMKLRPVSYQWKNDQSYTKLGVIAQEIQQVLPEVVRDWDYQVDEKTGAKTKVASARLGVMYDDILPVLIKGIQEQQQTIESLESTVANLQLAVTDLQNQLSSTDPSKNIDQQSAVTGQALLEQNIPNPAQQTTTIRFTIPDDALSANLIITNESGKTIQQFNNLSEGQSQIELSTSNLSSGSYQYTLYVDGKKVDSKKMMITK